MRRHTITEQRQLNALVSPRRQEILDVLAGMPRASIAQLGAALGRPVNGLYYHLRALVRVGLVRSAGRSRRRGELLYRAVAPEISIAYDPSSPANAGRVSAAVASMLRLGSRDFRRGFASARVVVGGPRRELWAGRATGWLTQPEIARVNRLMSQIYCLFRESRPRPGRRLFGITLLLVPLDRNGRRQKEKSRVR